MHIQKGEKNISNVTTNNKPNQGCGYEQVGQQRVVSSDSLFLFFKQFLPAMFTLLCHVFVSQIKFLGLGCFTTIILGPMVH